MTLHQNILGVDVAKDWIDTCDPASGRTARIETAPRALAAFVGRLPKDMFVVFEASGGYERPLMEALEAAGLAYARVNPRQAREFARATGRLAKTDRIDARVLAEMGQALKPAPQARPDPARRRLADLVARRADLVAVIAAETNRLGQAREAFVRRDIKSLIALLQRRRLAVEKEIEAQMRAAEDLDRLERRLRTAPGVGPVVAAVLIAALPELGLPELGLLDRRQLASLAGLAPHASESGRQRGRRKVWGGRREVRRALYIAAIVASRFNPDLRAFRDRLIGDGKPFKVAIIATARKLLTILNAMIRDHRDYA
jgi:transposase